MNRHKLDHSKRIPGHPFHTGDWICRQPLKHLLREARGCRHGARHDLLSFVLRLICTVNRCKLWRAGCWTASCLRAFKATVTSFIRSQWSWLTKHFEFPLPFFNIHPVDLSSSLISDCWPSRMIFKIISNSDIEIFGVRPPRLLFSTWAHLVWRSAAAQMHTGYFKSLPNTAIYWSRPGRQCSEYLASVSHTLIFSAWAHLVWNPEA